MAAAEQTSSAESPRAWGERQRKQLEQEVQSWLPHWRELGEFTLPRAGRWLVGSSFGTTSGTTVKANRGEIANQRIIDDVATRAIRVGASGMMSGLTSKARPWFRLTTPDPELAEFGSVKIWLHDVEQRMREVFARANTYNVLPQIYSELLTFGTACADVLEDEQDVIRLYPFTIGSYLLSTNERLLVDTRVRRFAMTIRQAAGKFGVERLSVAAQAKLQNGQTEDYLDIVHVVAPNRWRSQDSADNHNLPWCSLYYDTAADSGHILRFSGFYDFPTLAPRWETVGEDVYGHSPGMLALGHVKQVQHQQIRKAELIDKLARPPLSAPSSLRNGTIDQLPGGVTYHDQLTGANIINPIYVPNPSAIVALREDIQDLRAQIRADLFEDLFLMLANDERTQPPTAEEIVERRAEKMQMLGPVLERLEEELLNPLVDRTFNVMLRRGLIPEAPPELEGVELKVEYVSVLAQAQKMVATGGIQRVLGFATNLAQFNPDVLDKIDFDQAVDEFSSAEGVPPRLIRTDEQVAELRAQKAQTQALQNMVASAAPIAKAVKDASGAELEQDSVLSRVSNVVAGR